MKQLIIVVGAVLALGLAGCASSGGSGGGKMAAKPKTLDAKSLAKEFKKGSQVCKWTKPDGSKGQDFYFKTTGAYSGDADRMVGDKMWQGKWKIAGTGFYTNFKKGKKALGNWHSVAKVKKRTYDFYNAGGKKVISLKCS
jgi:hypothetical protein